MMLSFTNCANHSKQNAQTRKDDTISSEVKAPITYQEIYVGEKTFKKMLRFINKNGTPAVIMGTLIKDQFWFTDQKNNCHTLMTSRKYADHAADISDEIVNILVWSYKDCKEVPENFFLFTITPNKVVINDPKDYEAIKIGYNEFLEMVNKK